MNTHNCIKCQNTYEDADVEAYLCASCLEERKKFAETIDAKIATQPKEEHLSDLQIALQKGQRTGGALFVRASDLGITFS